jgi:D-alanine-D-alanine ligase-like ATP-grasp enzyme
MLMMPEQVLRSAFGARAEQVLEHAKEVAIKLAEAIERNYAHRLAELGFDLGIDQNENVWMFEANAKPGRSIFKHPSLKAQGRTSHVNLYEHCLYLSRFRARREG